MEIRRIKFRAWDKKAKCFCYSEFENPYGSGYLPQFWRNLNCYPERYVPVQYTGLKDLDGKKIWEGDIVEAWVNLDDISFSATHPRGIEVSLTKAKGMVQYDPPSFIIDFPFQHMTLSSSCRVIGNRFEDPKLLKEKSK